MDRIIGIVIALLALGIMMTIHELGHYISGRKLGFKIEEFMIFMGPVLWSWEKNDIKYSLRLFPIGAAVQFAGEMSGADDEEEEATIEDQDTSGDIPALVYDKNDPSLFMNRPKRYRAVVLAAGSMANILSGIIIFALIFGFTGYVTPDISTVPAGSQAAAAGLEVGDRVIRSNDQVVRTNLDLAFSTNFLGQADDLALTVKKADGRTEEVVLKPETKRVYQIGISTDASKDVITVLAVSEWQNDGNPAFIIGDEILEVNGEAVNQENLVQKLTALGGAAADYLVRRDGSEITVQSTAREVDVYTDRGIVMTAHDGDLAAVPYAASYAWSTLKTTFNSLLSIFRRQVAPTEALTGPVGIINMMSDVVVEQSFNFGEKLATLANLVAIISLSLGFTNLLPIPLLDGNHLLLLLVEAIRGKQLSSRAQTVITVAGLAIIIFLFAFGLYADVLRLIGR